MSILPDDVRARFHIPRDQCYLMSHSAGLMPVAARAALEQQWLSPWQEAGDAWPQWMAAIEGWRGLLAILLHVAPRDLCPTDCVTSGLLRYLSGLGALTDRRTILMAPSAFPSLGYAVSGLSEQGWRLAFLPDDTDVRDPAIWAAAIDHDTALVVPMHVTSVTGALSPIGEIATIAHQRGARCLVDCAQSAGVIPIDLAAWAADAAVGSCLKWLCGGPGAGWLWVDPADSGAMAPALRGWWSHADPFEMDIHRFRYADGAARFWGGTPTVAPFVTAAAGIQEIVTLGVPQIRAHNQLLQAVFQDALGPLPAAWRWPMGAIGGTICLDVGDAIIRLTAAASAQGVRVDARGRMMRLSFHAYNDEADAARAGAVLRDAI